MEGSGSGNKRGDDRLPPNIVPRRNRRRVEEENPTSPNGEEGVEIGLAELEPNLEPHPQHQSQPQQGQHQPELHHQRQQVVGGGGEMPMDQSRLANRRYSEAYRNRRDNHLQQLQIQKENLEAQMAQNIPNLHNSIVESSVLNQKNVALKQQFEIAFKHITDKEAETEKLRAEIEAERKVKESRDQNITNMATKLEYYDLQEALNNALSVALEPFFPFESMNPPTCDDEDDDSGAGGHKPLNPDEAGPSKTKDDDLNDM